MVYLIAKHSLMMHGPRNVHSVEYSTVHGVLLANSIYLILFFLLMNFVYFALFKYCYINYLLLISLFWRKSWIFQLSFDVGADYCQGYPLVQQFKTTGLLCTILKCRASFGALNDTLTLRNMSTLVCTCWLFHI